MMAMKIVVHMPNWIGDSVLALPSLKSIHQNFPSAQLWITAHESIKDLFFACDFIEGIISLPRQSDLKILRSSSKVLKEHSFDIGFLLPNSFSSALLFYLAKIPQRWGYQRDARRLLLTKGVRLKNQEDERHQVYYYLDLIRRLGFHADVTKLTLSLPEEEKARAQDFLLSLEIEAKRPLVILHPGAAYGPSKRWPTRKFAELSFLFQANTGAEILIIGSPEEQEVAESISASLTKKPVNLVGKTSLRLLAGLVSLASLFISNDSGPMHMANALNIPVVALFGPTNPLETGPFQAPSTIIKKDVPCSPCSYRVCPYDHRCLVNIEAEEVFEGGLRLLG